MPLKLDKKLTSALLGNNSSAVAADLELQLKDCPYVGLLQVLAVMFDDISKGEDVYMILGATQKKDAYTATVKAAGATSTIYGTSLEDLSAKLETLL